MLIRKRLPQAGSHPPNVSQQHVLTRTGADFQTIFVEFVVLVIKHVLNLAFAQDHKSVICKSNATGKSMWTRKSTAMQIRN